MGQGQPRVRAYLVLHISESLDPTLHRFQLLVARRLQMWFQTGTCDRICPRSALDPQNYESRITPTSTQDLWTSGPYRRLLARLSSEFVETSSAARSEAAASSRRSASCRARSPACALLDVFKALTA